MSAGQPEDHIYLRHILDAIGQIQAYLAGVDRARFDSTRQVQDSVIRQLEIIGEAATRISVSFRNQTAAIPWRKITGMRDKLAHDYLGVDLNAVWMTATADVQELKRSIKKLLGETGTGSNGA